MQEFLNYGMIHAKMDKYTNGILTLLLVIMPVIADEEWTGQLLLNFLTDNETITYGYRPSNCPSIEFQSALKSIPYGLLNCN